MFNNSEIEINIGGKRYVLSGAGSEEYLQKLAGFINKIIAENMKADSFRYLSADKQSAFVELSLADEYFKAKEQISIMEEDIKAKENELYELKHKLIAAEIKLEQAEKSLQQIQEDNSDKARTIVRLETELKRK